MMIINIAFNCTNYMTRAGSPSGLQNSIGANSQIIDPKLDSQYNLETDSPCIGTGTATVSERDYSGRYRKSLTYDIGAKWFNAHEDSTINTLLASGGTL